MLTNRAKTLIICGYLIFRGIAQVVEQRSPKPRAEGSNPSAPATGKALKPLGFRAFSLFFSKAAYGLFCRIGGRKSRVDFPFGGIRLKRFRLLHHQYTIKILAPVGFQPELSLFSAYISNPSVIPFSLAVSFFT